MARFFLPSRELQNRRATIAGAELNHLRRVLRLGAGDSITVFDDRGWEHEAILCAVSGERADLEIVRSYEAGRESPLQISLALGVTKGEKMDFVVEKATELGVHSILPFVSAYTVPKYDDKKISKRAERWRKIALSATKQSLRTRVPEVSALAEFLSLVKTPRQDALKLMFWEKERMRTLSHVKDRYPDARDVLLVVGAEGGFSNQEAEAAKENGFELIGLGPRILRAETAGLTVLALAQFLWGDLK